MELDRMMRGARDIRRERSSSRTFSGFNKSWKVGDKLTVFFPIMWRPEYDRSGNVIMVQEIDNFGHPVYEEDGITPKMTEKGVWDIVTASIWGHKVSDTKAFNVGGSFIPSLTDVYEKQPVQFERDENGFIMYDPITDKPLYKPVPGDVTYQFSLVAPLFVNGMKQRELSRVLDKKFPNEDMRREAIQQIEDKYDTNKSLKAPRPIISKLYLYASTEVIVVPMDSNDRYLPDKAAQYTYDFSSDQKFNNILQILDDVKFKPRDHEQHWIEVQMTFNANSDDEKGRAEAGRKAAPIGLTPEYTMEKRDPAAFAVVANLLSLLPQDSEIITHRNFSYKKKEERLVARHIENYVTLHSEDLDAIQKEEDVAYLLKQAYKLMKFKALDNMVNTELKEKIKKSYTEYVEQHPELALESNLATERNDYKEMEFKGMPTSRDLIMDAGQNAALPGENMDSDEEEVSDSDGGFVV